MSAFTVIRRTALILLGLEIVFVVGLTALNAFFAAQLKTLANNGADFLLFFLETAIIGFFWLGLLKKKTRLAKLSWIPIPLTLHMVFLTGVFYSGWPDIFFWSLLFVPPVLQMVSFLQHRTPPTSQV